MIDAQIQALLDELDPTQKTYAVEVDMGMQAREFCESDVGRYLIGCAHQEMASAQEQLCRTLPWRRRRIQELQNRIWRAESLLLWLRDLIVAGQSANHALEESSSE